MKNLIILIVLGVAGYFAYQHFGIPWLEGNNSAKPTFNMYSLPEECQSAGESLKNAIQRYDSNTSINGFTKNFRRCLRKAGFSDSQIDEACDRIRDSS